MIFEIIIGIIVLSTFLYFITDIVQRKRLKKLSKNGHKILCTIIKVNNIGLSFFGKSLYNVIVQPISKEEQKKYGNFKNKKFRGSWLIDGQKMNIFDMTTRNYMVNEQGLIGQEVPVYVNTNNKNSYAVDRSLINSKRIKRLP